MSRIGGMLWQQKHDLLNKTDTLKKHNKHLSLAPMKKSFKLLRKERSIEVTTKMRKRRAQNMLKQQGLIREGNNLFISKCPLFA